jgi:chromosomal replication initiation ATPase DnaA
MTDRRPFKEEVMDALSEYNSELDGKLVTIDDVKGRSQLRYIVEARRRVAKVLLARGWSLNKVADYIDRHHTTVMNLKDGRSMMKYHRKLEEKRREAAARAPEAHR